MIADRDIWRAANLLIREHGTNAEIVAAIESVAECPHGPGNQPERRRGRPMCNRQQSGFAKEFGLGRGRRAAREEPEPVAPETPVAPQPRSRRRGRPQSATTSS